jgi:hypothetical protein
MRKEEREAKLSRPVNNAELVEHKAYINSGYWEARKELYFERHPRECAVCGSPYVDLHHKFYGDYGQEPDSDLIPLCRRDHEAFHLSIGGSRKDMRAATDTFVERERSRLAMLGLTSKKTRRSIDVEIVRFLAKRIRPILKMPKVFRRLGK